MHKNKILNKQETEIKKRLFALGGIESHDGYFYELFKNDTHFTEAEKEALRGFYVLMGKNNFGAMLDDDLANVCLKWILTGEKKYYEALKDWFKWHLQEGIWEEEHSKKEQEKELQHEKKQKISGFIYLIKNRDLYKIGRAKNPKSRIKTYKTENPFKIEVIFQKKVDDYISKELELLKKFKDKNFRGEWFRLNKDDIQWIKQNI